MHSVAQDALVMVFVRNFENVSALMDGQEVIAHREHVPRIYRGAIFRTPPTWFTPGKKSVQIEVHVIERQDTVHANQVGMELHVKR